MKKIDWNNLEYDDFIGFVGVAAFLIYALYFGTLWYVTYDYRIETRDQMIEMYKKLPAPVPVVSDDYEIHQRRLVFYIDGVKTLSKLQSKHILTEYKEALEKEGWTVEREYTRNDKTKTFGINMKKSEFSLSISTQENKNTINILLIKEDWIYDKGF